MLCAFTFHLRINRLSTCPPCFRRCSFSCSLPTLLPACCVPAVAAVCASEALRERLLLERLNCETGVMEFEAIGGDSGAPVGDCRLHAMVYDRPMDGDARGTLRTLVAHAQQVGVVMACGTVALHDGVRMAVEAGVGMGC